MDKFFIILLVSIFVVIGFAVYHENKSVEPNVVVKKFVHNGHTYLAFKWSASYGSTILHDPDCQKCFILRNNGKVY